MRTSICVVPDCPHSSRSGGLCHGHYQGQQRMIRAGTATKEDLLARGLRLPDNSPGSGNKAVGGCSMFALGDKTKGKRRKATQ